MRILVVLLALCVAGLAAFLFVRPPAPAPTPVAAAPTPIERGRYLVTAMACGDCHSPHDQTGRPIKGLEYSGHPHDAPLPQWDPELLKKGSVATIAPTLTAFAGPFGVAVAPNLTPDLETGMVVSAEGLIESWRSGKHWKFNRPVLPPMPIQSYGSLTDEDIRAIYSFLMSLPAVKNETPNSLPSPLVGGK
jgi:hypothetical protein